MENLFETPAKELLKCAASSPVNVSGGQQAPDTTPPSTEMRTPPVLMEKDIEQFSNMMKPTIKDEGKKGNHPDPVKLPLLQQKKKPWEYPGRYMSPTDRIMSPISQTLLARNRKAVLPPSLIFSPPPKVLDGTCKDFGPSAPWIFPVKSSMHHDCHQADLGSFIWIPISFPVTVTYTRKFICCLLRLFTSRIQCYAIQGLLLGPEILYF